MRVVQVQHGKHIPSPPAFTSAIIITILLLNSSFISTTRLHFHQVMHISVDYYHVYSLKITNITAKFDDLLSLLHRHHHHHTTHVWLCD